MYISCTLGRFESSGPQLVYFCVYVEVKNCCFENN